MTKEEMEEIVAKGVEKMLEAKDQGAWQIEDALREKDTKIWELEDRIKELEFIAKGKLAWTRHQIGQESELPLPRLEIRWEKQSYYDSVAMYVLVKRHHLGHIERIPLGCTKVSHGGGYGDLDLPLRDGAHIYSDMKHLGLPGFVVNQETGAHRELTAK